MNDDTPDWRDDQPGGEGGYDRPRQEPGKGADRRASDPRFTDTRPPSYPADPPGPARDPAQGPSRASSPRERLSADYDEEPVFRRRNPRIEGGLAAFLGSDVMTRRLVYGAAGLGALLVVGVGGWSLLGGHSGGIPVIGPPPGPVRDRPADPGGMQIMGDGTDLDVTGKGEAHLAPEPEQPRPDALAARSAPDTSAGTSSAGKEATPATGAMAPDAASPGVVSSSESTPSGDEASGEGRAAAQPDQEPASRSPVTPAPVTPAPARREPAQDMPARAPRPAPKQESPATASTPKAATGTHMVQLAALGSEADARATWSRLSKQASDLLADREPRIEKKTINGHDFYRLRVGGFETAQTARAFCVRLHARSIACTPAVF